jgi:UDP-2,3-diacylglucosamine pyrophosphatase LpxH
VSYEANIAHGVQRAFDRANEMVLDAAAARYIIFSDQHKGQRDGADDFLASEPAYNAALRFYLEQGFTLFALGDVEELYENRAQPVLRAYSGTLRIEREFFRLGRYFRFWGNHDDHWSATGTVQRLLGPIFGTGIQVLEALRLKVIDEGKILGTLFLVHGHQGTFFGDRFRWMARPLVRYLWRPFQRLTRIRVTTPSTNYQFRLRHDGAMRAWAEAQPELVMIAGHTHHPVFDVSAPGYFNSGCCSFKDGTITGIEIVGGEIRLVRWPNAKGELKAEVVASAGLRKVFGR